MQVSDQRGGGQLWRLLPFTNRLSKNDANSTTMFIGLYFGSFNPVHNGHIQIAKEMLQQVGFDELWLVVSPQNPLKKSDELASNEHRLAMLELAVADLSEPIRVTDIEFDLPTPSYTYKTLEVLTLLYPTAKFGLVMGSDNLAVIEKWKEYQRLLQRYPVYFYPRKDDNSAELATRYGGHVVDSALLDISSTQVRELVVGAKPIDHLVSPAVARYITDNNLYR